MTLFSATTLAQGAEERPSITQELESISDEKDDADTTDEKVDDVVQSSAQEPTTTQEAEPSPTKQEAEQTEQQAEQQVPAPPPGQSWNIRLVYGLGLPLNQAKSPTHIQLDWSRPLGHQTEVGLYLSQSKASFHDQVDFPSTGYMENREYHLMNLGLGLSFSYRTELPLMFIANLGISRTTSELRSVTTTAPVPPTLTLGPIDAEVWSPSYSVGIAYERAWGPIALGSQLTFGSTSSNREAEIKDISLGLFIKLYHAEVEPPANP